MTSPFHCVTSSPVAFDSAAAKDTMTVLGHQDFSGDAAKVISGAAGCSPYLSGLMLKEADWLRGAVEDPVLAVQTELDSVPLADAKILGSHLRRAKRRVALISGLADLAGIWPLEQVTGVLTHLADKSVSSAVRAALAQEIKRGKLPQQTRDDAGGTGGIVVLAMGKMGAFELNYSSDIDLICLFDESRYDRDLFFEARASLIRATRRMTALLSDHTSEGYVFRTDLRLRPDPSVTPVCMAMEAAERYYESVGRAWERAAFVKARPCAGDLRAGASFLETLRPFVWRKHLDFAAIEDAHDMRLRYREQKGLSGAFRLDGHNVKLGRGGIRDIEFFTQTRQIIAGGRDADLRVRGTCEALGVLAEKDWVPEDTAMRLTEHYTHLRQTEHRLQMLRDQQTHSLPKADTDWARLAAFMGMTVADVQRELNVTFDAVHSLTEDFFVLDSGSLETAAKPAEHPFNSDVLSRWLSYPALRSERGLQLFERLRPIILNKLAATARPDAAFDAFDGFLSGLPAGVQVFSLFEANPQLIDLLIDIVGTVPDLGRYLARNSSVFDAVIAGDFFGPWPGAEQLAEDLAEKLAEESDYERKLDAARRWAKEWHFGIGVHHLRGLADSALIGARYADLAQACVQALLPEVAAQFATKHGPMPGRGAVVLGMGSLGAGRLNATSDLDLIVVYDPSDADMSIGPRPLPTRSYYARLTQALVTALSAPMAEGRLYEVDMRLRPSGTKGPVATSWQSFSGYQRETAWLWEHLALTRARVIAGPEDLSCDVEALRCEIVSRPRPCTDVFRELSEMRSRIQAAKSATMWDAKIGPGRLQDIELLAQAGLLCAKSTERSIQAGLRGLEALGLADSDQSVTLEDAWRFFADLQSVSRLLTSQSLKEERLVEQIGDGGVTVLLRTLGQEDEASLQIAVKNHARNASEAISTILTQVLQGDTNWQ